MIITSYIFDETMCYINGCYKYLKMSRNSGINPRCVLISHFNFLPRCVDLVPCTPLTLIGPP